MTNRDHSRRTREPSGREGRRYLADVALTLGAWLLLSWLAAVLHAAASGAL